MSLPFYQHYPEYAETTLRWSVSNGKVLRVVDGEIFAKREGVSTVYVKTSNNKKAKVRVTVKKNRMSGINKVRLTTSKIKKEYKDDIDILLKNMEYKYDGNNGVKLVCEFYVINGTPNKIRRLSIENLYITSGTKYFEGEIVAETYRTINVRNFRKYSYRTIKVTFKGDEVYTVRPLYGYTPEEYGLYAMMDYGIYDHA